MPQADLSTFVLVVADKAPARDALTAALAAVPTLRISTAGSVSEAVAHCRNDEQRIDLVIVDTALASGGAATLTRKLRDAQGLGLRRIPVLLVGDVAAQVLQAVMRLGIQGHVPGSFSADRLRMAVRDALAAAPSSGSGARAVRPADAPAPAQAAAPVSPAPVQDAPVANKPFRHGLQAPRPARAPITPDDAFGFETPVIALKPRPVIREMEEAAMPAFLPRRIAVA
jgi:DNA-binding NarL/FixJ family response regulator